MLYLNLLCFLFGKKKYVICSLNLRFYSPYIWSIQKKAVLLYAILSKGMKRITIIICLLMATSIFCRADDLLNGTAISGNGWVGLDLGTPHVITIVGWNPVGSNSSTQLGIFEGGNRSDFMDAVPLMIIEDMPQINQMHYASVSCSRGVRYVRYVAPSGKQNQLPSIALYGEPGAGNDSRLSQLTNLPTVTIHTRDNVVPYDKEHEIDCFISVISNDGATLLFDSATIRERGNASRTFPKKPYRIKFNHKHQVLGSPANAKKWTLINNYGDKTLMRNQLAFELSRRFGMPYTPFCAYVDVMLNGEYKGSYQLCDQIEVRKNRIDITEMTPRDNTGDALTGGYLIEADAYANEEPLMFWSTYGTPVTVKSPDEDSITSQQLDYITQRYNAMEANWQQNLDMNTFLRHFLVGEMSGNTDTYWSMYFYKQRGNDTLYVGPCWDFDLAFDNDTRTYHVCDRGDYIYRSGGSTVGYLRTLVDKIVIQDADAKQQLKNLWEQIRRNGFTEESMLDYIDEQAQLLDHSQRLNFIRWPILNQYVHQNPRVRGTYQAEVENVRNYMRNRFAWMDRKLGFDPATLESEITGEEKQETEKIMINGRIMIRRNGAVYSPAGQRITR